MSMKLLIADKFPQDKLAAFRALGLEVDYAPDVTADELPQRAADANILVVRSKQVKAATIRAARNLALVARAGAGYDNIDLAEASAAGIYVANCPGKNADAVAELTMGLILAVDRRIPQCTADLRAHRWNKKEYSNADGIKGRTLGIVGLGHIGQAVARRAAAFEMNVIGWSRSLTPAGARALGVGFCASLPELCASADIITVHLSQAPETTRLFNDELFAAMKPRAIFINASRGGIVDQKALVRAMREKGLRAGLDVFENEPRGGCEPFNDEILDLEGLVGTHHIGASTEQAQSAIADETIRIVKEFAATGRVPNCVNIATSTPACCQLVVRHYDKVGVLASVLDKLRRADINVEEMNNTVFQGAKAAVALIRLSRRPPDSLIKDIASMHDMIINVELKSL